MFFILEQIRTQIPSHICKPSHSCLQTGWHSQAGLIGLTHKSPPWTLDIWWRVQPEWRDGLSVTIIAHGYQSLGSLRNWLISSLPTADRMSMHYSCVERVRLCASVFVWKGRCHRWQGLSWEVDAGWTRRKMVSSPRHQKDVG